MARKPALTRRSTLDKGSAVRLTWSGKLPDNITYMSTSRLRNAVETAMGRMSSEMETHAKLTAPWTDRTGNARQGLYSNVRTEGASKVIVELGHGPAIHYGKYLETAHKGKYAVIGPTLERYAPSVPRRIQQEFD